MNSKTSRVTIFGCSLLGLLISACSTAPRPNLPGSGAGTGTSTFRVHPDRPLQVIKGLGFEIQSDSIGSGNQGLPENRVAVPHDLIPSERDRLSDEMLRGFRYCRLAGGLYWRGLDADGKQLVPRWPGQLEEIRVMLARAGVEGLSFEYWSPTPFWKANRRYIGRSDKDPANTLRCFGPDFASDPVYHGDVDRFLADFAAAMVKDLNTLKAAGLKVSMWGMQNEPFAEGADYPKCPYFKSEDYVRAYKVVASAVRAYDPSILLFSDTEAKFPHKIGPGMNDPTVAALVDAYAVHTIGEPSANVRKVNAEIKSKLPTRPWFQNEYEYFTATSPERCLNTVQHIMNSFQLAENPTWFWIHALKPLKNSEASGYSLGIWKSLEEPTAAVAVGSNSGPLSQAMAGLKPGHWIYNPYNWNAVGSFVKRLPWDSIAITTDEAAYQDDARIFTFKKPNGKFTVVVSNSSDHDHHFDVETGLSAGIWRGYRYTPDEAGVDTLGVSVGNQTGPQLALTLSPLTWEFWEQQ